MRYDIAARLAALLTIAPGDAGAQRAALVARIDSIIEAPITARRLVGASVAVVRGDRDTILVKGYGKANAELDVPTPPGAIYEIGSITKQFTAVAIMQLVEQGKVKLDDDISVYLPGFDTQGRRIPVRRLLDHTSGIKGYTEIPEFRTLMPFSLPRDTLLAIVKTKPYDFEPGEEQIYNNTAYFLLGLVIEKASGMSYDKYVEQNLFERLGMKGAHYCSERAIHKGKVSGYDFGPAGPIQRAPISHTWPYAAGSLCTSAVDLVTWNRALHRDGKLLGAAAYRELITPRKLNDGTTVGYAMGLAVGNRLGRRALQHGGGINGFVSQNTYFPDESLSVVVLFNTAGPADAGGAAEAIAEAILGKAKAEVRAFDGDLSRYAGTFKGRGRGAPAEVTVSVEGTQLKLTRRGQSQLLTWGGGNTFNLGYTRFIFIEEGGKVTAMRVDTGAGNNVLRKG